MHREQIVKLAGEHLGVQDDDLREQLSGRSPRSFDGELSPILIDGARVIGFVLGWVLPGGQWWTEATVVDPAYRGRWATTKTPPSLSSRRI